MHTLFVSKSRQLSHSLFAAGFSLALAAGSANAAMVPAGPGGFDDGWATQIIYDDAADRGTSNNRDNPLNALGAANGTFFEIGSGATADFTFGAQFNADVTIYEITFGNVSRWEESVDLFAGTAGDAASFQAVGSITNAAAQGGVTLSLAAVSGLFDTIRLVDTSNRAGGFDVDAVRITPVPLPAAAWLFLSALGAVFGLKRLQHREQEMASAVA